MELKEKLLQIIHSLEGFEEYSYDELQNLNYIDEQLFDSIVFVSLIVELESEFDICISNENMLVEEFSTLNKIYDLVLSCIEKRNG